MKQILITTCNRHNVKIVFDAQGDPRCSFLRKSYNVWAPVICDKDKKSCGYADSSKYEGQFIDYR